MPCDYFLYLVSFFTPRRTWCSSPAGFGVPIRFIDQWDNSRGLHPGLCSVTPSGFADSHICISTQDGIMSPLQEQNTRRQQPINKAHSNRHLITAQSGACYRIISTRSHHNQHPSASRTHNTALVADTPSCLWQAAKPSGCVRNIHATPDAPSPSTKKQTPDNGHTLVCPYKHHSPTPPQQDGRQH